MSVLVRSTCLAVLVFVSAGAVVLSGQADKITASEGWVRTPAGGDKTAMAFVEIENPTMYDVYFTAGAADVAGKVEFRDKTKPQAVEFIIVPAYGTLSMDADSVYMMLVDLKRPLKDGDKVALTLSNQDGVKLQVAAAVRNK
jgi:periplasmic copper chaperone A